MKDGDCHPTNGCRRAVYRLQKRYLIGGEHLDHLITWGVSRDRKLLGKAVFLCLCHVSGQSNDLQAEEEDTRPWKVDCGSWVIPRFEAQQVRVSSSDGEIRKEELLMSIILDVLVLNLTGDILMERSVLKGLDQREGARSELEDDSSELLRT